MFGTIDCFQGIQDLLAVFDADQLHDIPTNMDPTTLVIRFRVYSFAGVPEPGETHIVYTNYYILSPNQANV